MSELDLSKQIRPEAFQTRISRLIREAVISHLPEISGAILDVGCGNGLFILELLGRKTINEKIFGLDLDFQALINGKTLLMDNSQTGERFVCGDAQRLPFRDNTFGAVFCMNTLVNLTPFSTVELLISEIYRITSDGGYIIFDFRNAENPLLRLKYRRNLKKGGVTTVAHRAGDFKLLFRKLNINEIQFIPVGKIFFIPGMGVLVIARK